MQKKLLGLVGGIALLAVLSLALAVIPAKAADDGPIGDVMTKLFKGSNAANAQLKKQLAVEPPVWKDIQATTKVFAEHGVKIVDHAPPKGEAPAYKKLAEAFADNTKKLDESAKKEDLVATKETAGKIGASCKSCHAAHRP